MLKFLLDANLSRETADFLTSLGYDAKTVAHFRLESAEDSKVAERAIRDERILITLDSDFGEIFYFSAREKFWVIVLKLKDQTVDSVNRTLAWLLRGRMLETKEFRNTLMIVEPGRVKVRRKF